MKNIADKKDKKAIDQDNPRADDAGFNLSKRIVFSAKIL